MSSRVASDARTCAGNAGAAGGGAGDRRKGGGPAVIDAESRPLCCKPCPPSTRSAWPPCWSDVVTGRAFDYSHAHPRDPRPRGNSLDDAALHNVGRPHARRGRGGGCPLHDHRGAGWQAAPPGPPRCPTPPPRCRGSRRCAGCWLNLLSAAPGCPQVNKMYMGCHSDSGFVHQVRGFSSQMVFVRSLPPPGPPNPPLRLAAAGARRASPSSARRPTSAAPARAPTPGPTPSSPPLPASSAPTPPRPSTAWSRASSR